MLVEIDTGGRAAAPFRCANSAGAKAEMFRESIRTRAYLVEECRVEESNLAHHIQDCLFGASLFRLRRCSATLPNCAFLHPPVMPTSYPAPQGQCGCLPRSACGDCTADVTAACHQVPGPNFNLAIEMLFMSSYLGGDGALRNRFQSRNQDAF